MSNPGEEHWVALGRLIGYMKGMEIKGMILRKPVDLRTVSLMDSDFAKSSYEEKRRWRIAYSGRMFDGIFK